MEFETWDVKNTKKWIDGPKIAWISTFDSEIYSWNHHLFIDDTEICVLYHPGILIHDFVSLNRDATVGFVRGIPPSPLVILWVPGLRDFLEKKHRKILGVRFENTTFTVWKITNPEI